jgi:hypothetical protein
MDLKETGRDSTYRIEMNKDMDQWRARISTEPYESSGSIKDGGFPDLLSNYQLLKKKCAPCSYLFIYLVS